MPGLVLLFALGASFNPILVGLTGAAGGAIGELSGYALGYSGTAFIRNTRLYLKAEDWMKWLGSVAIFLFSRWCLSSISTLPGLLPAFYDFLYGSS